MLLFCACTLFEFISGEPGKAENYDASAIFSRCAASKEGGGLIGGTAAHFMYGLLKNVGSIFVLVLLILIFLMVLTQFSPVEVYRKAEQERIRRGDPSFMEKRKAKAAAAREASARRREAIAREKERDRIEREELQEKERANREERRRLREEKRLEEEKRRGLPDMSETMIELSAQDAEEEEDFGLDEGSTLFRRNRKSSNTQDRKEAGRSPERIRTGTAHGIRFLDRDREAPKRAEEVRVSAAPVNETQGEPSERILRPDANTVRVESEDLIKVDPAEGTGYTGRQGRATMTVFTQTKDSGESDDELHFPFYQEGNERGMRRVYAKESAAEKLVSGSRPDIADAGGMSSFNAQQERRGNSS
jgi:hypothetical protein